MQLSIPISKFYSQKPSRIVLRNGVRKLLLFLFLFAGFYQSKAQYNLSVCSGSAIPNYTPPGALGTDTYTWLVLLVSPPGAVNAAPQGTPQTSVNAILVNNTTAPADVTYLVTPSSGGSFTLVVTVKPKPALSGSTITSPICSGSNFSYIASSTIAGTSFSWSRAFVNGISPNNNSLSSTTISESLTNTTTNPATATYSYILTADGCSNTQNISVVVNPKPGLTSSVTPSDVCSGSQFSYTPISDQSPNVTFTWTRDFVPGISNGANTGLNSPDETLVNTQSLLSGKDTIFKKVGGC